MEGTGGTILWICLRRRPPALLGSFSRPGARLNAMGVGAPAAGAPTP